MFGKGRARRLALVAGCLIAAAASSASAVGLAADASSHELSIVRAFDGGRLVPPSVRSSCSTVLYDVPGIAFVAVSSRGTIFAYDACNGRLYQFTAAGSPVAGWHPPVVNHPDAIVPAPGGTVRAVYEQSPGMLGPESVEGYTASGARDRMFGQGGSVTLPSLEENTFVEAAAEPDGGLLVQMDGGVTDNRVLLMRLDAHGQLDPTFGSSGQVAITLVVFAIGVAPDSSLFLVEEPAGGSQEHLVHLSAAGASLSTQTLPTWVHLGDVVVERSGVVLVTAGGGDVERTTAGALVARHGLGISDFAEPVLGATPAPGQDLDVCGPSKCWFLRPGGALDTRAATRGQLSVPGPDEDHYALARAGRIVVGATIEHHRSSSPALYEIAVPRG
ncbi:MAG TPA: hypothetical protein VHX88_08250 [Solirubrobacteraceae bacterium]|jgi:hypothetical protein|nr:hypothetical protein [Solirubrobacteraceae bacterium]